MSKLKGFTLLELIIVVIIIGIVSFLVLKLPTLKENNSINIQELRDFLYPNGKIIILKGNNIISTKKIDIKITNPQIYVFKDSLLIKKVFDEINNTKIVFKYEVKRGIGDSFILKCNEGIYVFKPFYIKKVSSFDSAKTEFLNLKYQPYEGSFY